MNVYSRIRNILPKGLKGNLSAQLVNLGLKPTVNRKVTNTLKKGILIFSADFEMAWAFRYSKKKGSKCEQIGLQERVNMAILTSLFEKHGIPVTWATVGHLFLSSCDRDSSGLPHSAMVRPGFFENRNWLFSKGDWYDHDPCSSVNKAPAWYAPDLISQIINSQVKHEIGCHTFSHIDFSYHNCPTVLAEAELDNCIKLASDIGVTLRSMVFPGGTAGNYETLKKKGFSCYRKPMMHHIDMPFIDEHGLVAIPSSLGLDRDPYGWSASFHIRMLKNFLQKTANHKQVCHFWFHPSMDTWYLTSVLPELLKTVVSYRENNEIEVFTMGQLADKVLRDFK